MRGWDILDFARRAATGSPLRTLLLEEFNHVPVLSFAELGSASKVKVLGRFDLGQDELMRGAVA